jgi:hypothetical protein
VTTTVAVNHQQPSAPLEDPRVTVRLDRAARSKLAKLMADEGDGIRSILEFARTFPRVPWKLEVPRGRWSSTRSISVSQETYDILEQNCCRATG